MTSSKARRTRPVTHSVHALRMVPGIIPGSDTSDVAAIEVARMLTRQPEAHFYRAPGTGEYTAFLAEALVVRTEDTTAMSALNRVVDTLLQRGAR